MNIYQAWFTFYTLSLIDWEDVHAENEVVNEGLLQLLSDSHPYTWGDEILSADPACFDRFAEIWGDMEQEKSLDEAYDCIVKLYKYYENTFNKVKRTNANEIISFANWEKYAEIIKTFNNKNYSDKNEWFDLLKLNKSKFQ
jgi:hypothetical protein